MAYFDADDPIDVELALVEFDDDIELDDFNERAILEDLEYLQVSEEIAYENRDYGNGYAPGYDYDDCWEN